MHSTTAPHLLLQLALTLQGCAPHRLQLRLQPQQLLQPGCIHGWRAGRLALPLRLRLRQRQAQLLLPLRRLRRLAPLLALLLFEPRRSQLIFRIVSAQQQLLLRQLPPQRLQLAAA